VIGVSAGWVLIQTSEDVAPEVAAQLAGIPGVERAEQTVGAYDVVVRVADAGSLVPSAKRLARAALQIPGVTVAVCCHDGPVSGEDASRDRTIDLTDSSFGQAAEGQAAEQAEVGPARSGDLATL
jgi:hypothetical protein